jgi:hypothetical protein
MLWNLYTNLAEEIQLKSPHIRTLLEALSYQSGYSLAYIIYLTKKNGTGIVQYSDKDLEIDYNDRKSNYLIFYNRLRFQNDDSFSPFETVNENINSYNKKRKCNVQIRERKSDPYSYLYDCYSFDTLISLFPLILE